MADISTCFKECPHVVGDAIGSVDRDRYAEPEIGVRNRDLRFSRQQELNEEMESGKWKRR